MREIVLDTNVLVAALRSRRGASYQLIGMIGTGVFRPNISVALALEYEEILKRADLVPGLTEGDVDKIPELYFPRPESRTFRLSNAAEPRRSG
jgi:predicted nucleic acid-binding protein